jgi:tetratricopeptide (TPR) repeat protein
MDPKIKKPGLGRTETLARFAAPFVLVLACFGAFSSSLPNGFTNWDDNWLITDNPWVKEATLENVTTILDLSTPVKVRAQLGGEYLPVRDLSTMLDHLLYGEWAMGHHVTNLILHVMVTLLLFLLLLRAGAGSFLAFAAALLFGLHPVHVESVAWLSSRKDLLAALFSMLGALAWLRFLKARRGGSRVAWYSACLGAFALAVTSKYMAVTLPALLLWYTWLCRPDARAPLMRRALFRLAGAFGFFRGLYGVMARRGWVRRAAAPLLALVPFFVLDLVFVKFVVVAIASRGLIRDYYGESFSTTLLTVCKVFAEYIAMLLYPRRLLACVDYPLTHSIDAGVVAAAALLAALAAGSLWVLWRTLRRPDSTGPVARILAFTGASFFIVLSPVSNVLFPMGTLFAERYLYMAVISSVLALGLFFEGLRRAGRAGRPVLGVAAWVLLGGLAVLYGMQTFNRCRVWHDSGTLWRDTLAQSGGAHHTAHFNLGNFYTREAVNAGEYGADVWLDKAREQLLKALSTRHLSYNYDYGRVHAALGTVETLEGNIDSALRHYDEALAINQKSMDTARSSNIRAGEVIARAEIYLNKGQALSKAKDAALFPKAVACFEKAIDLNPDLALAYLNLGLLRYEMGRCREDLEGATDLIRRAGRMNPYLDEVPLNLVIIAYNEGRDGAALTFFNKVLARRTQHLDARFYRGAVFLRQRRFTDARAAFRSIEDVKDVSMAWSLHAREQVGISYEMEGDVVEAEKVYLSIIRAAPHGLRTIIEPVRNRLADIYLAAGSNLMSKGNYEEARDLFARAVSVNPTAKKPRISSAQAALHIGSTFLEKAMALREKGDLDGAAVRFNQAAEYFKDALRFYPTFEAYYAVAECAKKLGAIDAAVEALEKALSLHPGSGVVADELMRFYIARGEAHRKKMRPERALAWFRRAGEVNPVSPDPWRILASIYERGAEKAAERMRENRGDPKEVSRAKKERSENLRAALDAYDRVLVLRPKSIAALSSRGRILAQLDRLADALATFEKLAVLQPKEGNHHYNVALILSRLRRVAESIKAYEKGLRIAPEHQRIVLALTSATLREGLRLRTVFLQTRRRAVAETDPTRREAVRLRLDWMARQALAYFTRHLELVPGNNDRVAPHRNRLLSYLDFRRALPLVELKAYSEALDTLERAAERDPGNAEAAHLLVRVLRGAKADLVRERALLLLRGKIKLRKKDWKGIGDILFESEMSLAGARYGKGLEASRQEAWKEALVHFDRAILLFPAFPYSHYYRASALEMLNRGAEAREAYGRAVDLLTRHLEKTLDDRQRALANETLAEARSAMERLLQNKNDKPPSKEGEEKNR